MSNPLAPKTYTSPDGTVHHLLTPEEAAEFLRRSVSSVRSMIRRGRLRAKRVRGSRLLLVAREDLLALLEDVEPDAVDETAGLRIVDGSW